MTRTLDARPQSLDELVGCEALRQKASIAVAAALARGEPLPHTLISSNGGGLGKSTFAVILANEMFSPLVSTTGQCVVSPADLRRLLIRMEPGTTLVLDEFHAIGPLAAEELLVVLESGVLNVNLGAPVSMRVPPFTLVAATTQLSAIGDSPLLQRFPLRFHFDFYDADELRRIVTRMAQESGVAFDEEVCLEIAKRAQGVPRKALRLVERVRDVAQAQRATRATSAALDLAMGLEGIDHLGLRAEDRRILEVLADADPRPVSARSLALALGTGTATVTGVLEPTLVRLRLMMIGSGGRRITERGLAHVRSSEQGRLSA